MASPLASSPAPSSTPVSGRWAQAQRATPSFQASQATTSALAATALDRAIPASLAPYGAAAAAEAQQQAVVNSPNPPAAAAAMAATSPRPRARTPGSASRSTTKPVHEDLLERGRLYEQRKEAMQERAIRGDLRRCRSTPKVTKMAQAMERQERIIDRLYRLDSEKRKMSEFKQMETDRREEKIFGEWFKPKLSRRGQRTQGRSMKAQHDLWQYRREVRLHDQRMEQIAREMANVQDAPDINPRSAHMASRRREAEGLAGYTHIEAMIERDRLGKLAQWEREQLRQQVENPHTPRITEMAARMRSDMDVVDRLVARGQEREEKMRALASYYEDQRDQEAADHAAMALGAGGRSTPRRTRAQAGGSDAASPARPHAGRPDEFGDVYQRNAEFARRRDRNIQAMRDAEDQRHNPELDPTSLEMASRLRETPQDRLLRPRTPTRGADASDTQRARTPGGGVRSLRPHGSSVSPAPTTPRPGTPTRQAGTPTRQAGTPESVAKQRRTSPTAREAATYERLMNAERQRQRRLDAARDEQRRRDDEGATFAPTLSRGTVDRFPAGQQQQSPAPHAVRAADEMPPAGTPPPAATGDDSSSVAQQATPGGRSPAVQRIYDRTMQWQRKREERLAAEKQRQEAEDAADCTFEPDTSTADHRIRHDPGLYGGDGRAWGFDDYVARQQAARQQRGDEPAEVDGQQRTPSAMDAARRATVPQPPELGRRDDVFVPSLSPPVRPPPTADTGLSGNAFDDRTGAPAQAAQNLASTLMSRGGVAAQRNDSTTTGGLHSGGMTASSGRSTVMALGGAGGNLASTDQPATLDDDDVYPYAE